MNTPALFLFKRDNPNRLRVIELVIATIRELAANDDEFQISLSEIKRTLDQNAAMWPALTDICKQVPLVITRRDGSNRKATPYDWKDIFTAAFEEETEWAPGLRGGVVMLGARTSKYSKKKMGDFLTFLRAEGNDRGVIWSEKANHKFDEYIKPAKKAA